jgi:hypothetical protein
MLSVTTVVKRGIFRKIVDLSKRRIRTMIKMVQMGRVLICY